MKVVGETTSFYCGRTTTKSQEEGSKVNLSNKTFQEPAAAELTAKRIQARQKRRLTYDCMKAITNGVSVTCKEGHDFKKVGLSEKEGMGLLGILRGRSSSVCQNCEDYDGETNE